MNLSLFLYSLKSNRGGIIAWCVFLFIYALIMVYMLQSMQDIAELIAEYMDKFGTVVAIFAGEIGSILNPDGSISLGKWLSVEFLALWPVMMSIYAIFYAGGITAHEVERGTMDMLLSQPIPRHHIITSKFLVFPLAILAVAVACVIGILIGMAIIGNFSDIGGACLAFFPALLIALAVASYSLLFSCIFLDPRKVMLAAGSLTGLFYIFNILARTVGPLKWLGNLSIFHYYEPGAIASGMNMNWLGIGIYLGIIVTCFVASIYVFQRRDIVS
ncbi:ABC transporter permease subunit [Chloroflexota bacterium]